LEGTYLNIIKAMYEKPAANNILTGEKLSFSSKIRNKTRMSTLNHFIQHNNGTLNYRNQIRKRNKRHSN